MDNLTKFAIAALVFYFLFMRKEGFALAPGVLTNKNQLDSTFFYKRGTLTPNIRNTISAAINNGETCAAEFPQEIYIPIPKVPAVCELPQNIQTLYVDVPQENSETCPNGMKTLSKIDNRELFNSLTTKEEGQNYVNPEEGDCFSQLYNSVENRQQFSCGSINAQCRFNTPEALEAANVETNYNINETDIRPASQW